MHVVQHTHVQDCVPEAISFPQQMVALLAVTALMQQSPNNRPLTGTDRKMQRSTPEIHDASTEHWAKEAARNLMRVTRRWNERCHHKQCNLQVPLRSVGTTCISEV